MPELKRSVAVFESELERPQRARLSELEQMIKKFRIEKNYSSVIYVMDTVDGLKRKYLYNNYKISKMIDEEQVEREQTAMEKHENRKEDSIVSDHENLHTYGLLAYESRDILKLNCKS